MSNQKYLPTFAQAALQGILAGDVSMNLVNHQAEQTGQSFTHI